ncbi:hypothetical protein J4731_14400 [Providencia rettgeri]|nr:hypothetical protein [Providencia rettgeri]
MDVSTSVIKWSCISSRNWFLYHHGAFCSFLAPIIRVEVDKMMNSNTAGIVTLAVITVGCAVLIALLKKTHNNNLKALS